LKKILIFEPLKNIIANEHLLNRANIQMFTASSAKEILSVHKAEKPDLIIIDLDMPDMPGDAVCTALLKGPDMNGSRIIIATEPAETDIKRCEECGAGAYITKPVNPVSLMTKIASSLDIPVRKAYRMPIKMTITGQAGNLTLAASTVNISSSGMLIETRQKLIIGDILNCSFLLPGTLTISVTGEVKRVITKTMGNIYHYGVYFTSIDPSAKRIIEDFVKSRIERAG